MKLRQLKRQHVQRLRRHIARRELQQQFKKTTDDLATALVDALLAPGRLAQAVLRQIVREIATPITDAVAAAGGLPGSSVGGCVTSAVMALPVGKGRAGQLLHSHEHNEFPRTA